MGRLWKKRANQSDIIVSGHIGFWGLQVSGAHLIASSPRTYSVSFVVYKSALVYYEAYRMPTPHSPTVSVRRALRKLGADIRDARKRRRLPMGVVANRAFTSRGTLQRIEAGDPGVGMGIYAATLHALGLLDGLSDLADIKRDTVGQALATTELPERARLKRKKSCKD
jgi:hypothetical protein